MMASIDDDSRGYLEEICEWRTRQRVENETIAMNVTLLDPEKEKDKNNEDNDKMLMDSGAGGHMTNRFKHLRNPEKLEKEINIRCAGNNTQMKGTHIGDMSIYVRNRFDEINFIILQNVIYVPNLWNNCSQ